MSNVRSIELGWIITDHDSDSMDDHKAFFDIAEAKSPDLQVIGTENSDETYDPDALDLETHPCDPTRVFVSLRSLEDHGMSGDDLKEPKKLGFLVRGFVAQVDNSKVVSFGVIQTER